MVKFSADALFDGYRFRQEGTVLVLDKEGRVADLLPAGDAGGDVRHLRGILCPGFVNCHCHLELSHLKGHMPEKTGLTDFLLGVMKFRGHFSETIINDAMEQAEEDMFRAGIVAVGDIVNTAVSLPLKKRGRLHYHTFVEVMGVAEQDAAARFAAARELYTLFRSSSPGEAGYGPAASVVPHAPYSVSPALLRLINDFPGNALLSIHNQESAAEDHLYRERQGDLLRLYHSLGIKPAAFRPSGLSSLRSWLPALNRHPLLLVHNTYTTEEDWAFAAAAGQPLYACLCPNANLYIENRLPDIAALQRQGIPIALGTDSLASNHSLSILAEIKTLQQRLPALSVQTLLHWATAGGAKALQLDDRLGSFEKGKQPGVLLISGEGRLSPGSTAERIS
ncbi:amidohydrolase family protein [Compostibacter hankyongensis]|uniref:Amidohydrolase family protein n=1 Tax=Compostibacter hankyongensis TaxID=1007089 RepID=A0ABP8FDC9_9BACT